MPEARPPSSGAADDSAIPREGMNAIAMPAAATRLAGSTSTVKLPSGRMNDNQTRPRAGADHPDHDCDGQRQQRRAAGEGAQAEDLLQVQVEEEEHRDPRGAEQE